MANNSGKGTGFEYDVCQLFTEQNYFTRRSIPIRSTINQDITDVDVLGIKYTYPFEKKVIICDCKNKVKPKPFERIFWTKGLGEYVGVDDEYIALGSEVHIDMFDDRIEIYSPGGMVSGISLEGKDLLKIPSKRRNPILADIFSRLKYMERRGSGFKKILADYEGQVEFNESKMPVFDADNDDFTLTLYNLNYGTNYATQVKQNGTQGDTQDDTRDDTQGDTQDDTQEKIIKMIEENPRVSTSDMAKRLGIGIATVKRKIKKMPNISYVGSGYSGHWEIK